MKQDFFNEKTAAQLKSNLMMLSIIHLRLVEVQEVMSISIFDFVNEKKELNRIGTLLDEMRDETCEYFKTHHKEEFAKWQIEIIAHLMDALNRKVDYDDDEDIIISFPFMQDERSNHIN